MKKGELWEFEITFNDGTKENVIGYYWRTSFNGVTGNKHIELLEVYPPRKLWNNKIISKHFVNIDMITNKQKLKSLRNEHK